MFDHTNDAGRLPPALHHNNQSAVSVAHPPATAKRCAWLDEALADADARWHAQHLLPLAVLALGALRR